MSGSPGVAQGGKVLLGGGIALVGLYVVLGWGEAVAESFSGGASLVRALFVRYGYLTTLVNEWALLIWLAVLTGWNWLGIFRHPAVQASAAATILVAMLYHHFFLGHGQWDLEGIAYFNNVVGHYAGPLAYLFWWLTTLPRAELGWQHYPVLLVPALAYPAYVLARGALTGAYPYGFLDAGRIGYLAALGAMGKTVAVFALFCALALLANAVARRLAPQSSMPSSDRVES